MATATSASSTSSSAASSGQGGGANSAPAASEAGHPPVNDSRLSEPLRAERRKNNQLEKEIRTLRQQLNRFSEINPEEYSRLQEAERQKQVLEKRMELRERQMEEASAQKVAAVASERDEAKQQVLQLRKDRLLERAFSQAEGRNGGDARGTAGR
jgi:exonuclease VII large subunit